MDLTKLAAVAGVIEVLKETQIGKQILEQVQVRAKNLEVFLEQLVNYIKEDNI